MIFKEYDAIFVVSDYYVIELMNFLINAGYHVPHDIWVVELCKCLTPQLLSVQQDVRLSVKRAVEYLQRMKNNRDYSITEKCLFIFFLEQVQNN